MVAAPETAVLAPVDVIITILATFLAVTALQNIIPTNTNLAAIVSAITRLVTIVLGMTALVGPPCCQPREHICNSRWPPRRLGGCISNFRWLHPASSMAVAGHESYPHGQNRHVSSAACAAPCSVPNAKGATAWRASWLRACRTAREVACESRRGSIDP
ncbi:hypothetical protein BDY21DRAFT_355146 [Lineolata rhizophorae]|uniref:Uncharacterized protein n=1 Tax=Lineolata rhizophorae TaxID=578093 RepID=A0A6A6NQV6_9PEZI|nr:hypothetical protein BDY21DRAFT_355146 [Lineolata rhizophorae]